MANIKIIISLKQKDSFIVQKVCKLLPKVHSSGGDGTGWSELEVLMDFFKSKTYWETCKKGLNGQAP